jgi:hypothetical protein
MIEHMTTILEREFRDLGEVEILNVENRSALVLTGLDTSLYYIAVAVATILNYSGWNVTVI